MPGPGSMSMSVGVHRLAAHRAVRLDVRDLPAGAMAIEDRRPRVPGGPAVAPRDHRHEHVDELQALRREHVLVARGALGVGALLEHPLVDEVAQPLGEHLARDAEVALDVVEAGDADEDVADHERRPRLAGDREAARDRTAHLGEVGALHDGESIQGTDRATVRSFKERNEPEGATWHSPTSSTGRAGSAPTRRSCRRRRSSRAAPPSWRRAAGDSRCSSSTQATSSTAPPGACGCPTCSRVAASCCSTTSGSPRTASRAPAARCSPTRSPSWPICTRATRRSRSSPARRRTDRALSRPDGMAGAVVHGRRRCVPAGTRDHGVLLARRHAARRRPRLPHARGPLARRRVARQRLDVPRPHRARAPGGVGGHAGRPSPTPKYAWWRRHDEYESG